MTIKLGHTSYYPYHMKVSVYPERIIILYISREINKKNFELLQSLEDSAEETDCFFGKVRCVDVYDFSKKTWI